MGDFLSFEMQNAASIGLLTAFGWCVFCFSSFSLFFRSRGFDSLLLAILGFCSIFYTMQISPL
jgi:hypothetical protein